jgi:uncharacterized membrane protein
MDFTNGPGPAAGFSITVVSPAAAMSPGAFYLNPVCEDNGLVFPGTAEPDYWDFMYFSVVLSMTFQVSDVQITARPIRRLALLHGIVASFFNVTIIAITVNVVAGIL